MKEILIQNNLSLREVINKLNELGTKTLVVADNNNKLLGTISDGDIRKALLSNQSIDSPIQDIFNKIQIYKNYLSK